MHVDGNHCNAGLQAKCYGREAGYGALISDGLCARIDRKAVRVLPIFRLIAEKGGIPERDMFNTFNMGVGMSITVPADEAEKALDILKREGENAYVIGDITESADEKIRLED